MICRRTRCLPLFPSLPLRCMLVLCLSVFLSSRFTVDVLGAGCWAGWAVGEKCIAQLLLTLMTGGSWSDLSAQPWTYSVPVFVGGRRKFVAVLSEALYTYEAIRWICEQIPLLEGWKIVTIVGTEFTEFCGTLEAVYLHILTAKVDQPYLKAHPYVYTFPETAETYNAERFTNFFVDGRRGLMDDEMNRSLLRRGGYGKQLKEKIERIAGRCRQVKRLAEGLCQEIEELYDMTHRPEKRRRAAGEGEAEEPDRPGEEPPTQPYDEVPEPGDVERGQAHNQHGEDADSSNSEIEDDNALRDLLHNELGAPEGRLWTIRTGIRSRRSYEFQYLSDRLDIADLHFEYARVAKKGAVTFALQADSILIDGKKRLESLSNGSPLIAVPWKEDTDPPSSMRRGGVNQHRGGAAASARSKLARKLNKSAAPVTDPVGLLRLLWTREGDSLARLSGTPDQCMALVNSLIAKHHIRHTAAGWEFGANGVADPWVVGDPWAMAKAGGVKVHQMADEDKLTDFEQLDLLSTVVNDKGEPLKLVRRDNFVTGTQGVVLSEANHVPALLAMAGDKGNLLILAPTRVVAPDIQSERTQVLTVKSGKAVPKFVYATFAGTSRHSIVHPAADIKIEESAGVSVTMKAVRSLVNDDVYSDFGVKDKVCACLARFLHDVRIVQFRRIQEPEAQIWQLEASRGVLPCLLALSGRDNITLSVPRSEEASLDCIAVFVDALCLDQVWRSISDVPHYGVAGPTQRGQAVIRAPRTGVGAVRARALSHLSPYSKQWDLVIEKKFVGRFTATIGMESIASSISTTLGWSCVALQTKRVGKNQQIITLGAASLPPTRHVAINGEITVLTELNAKDSGITASFAPAFEVVSDSKDEPMGQASASSSSLPDALQEKCKQSLKTMQHQSEQQCGKLVVETEKKLKELQDQVRSDLKKFVDGEAQQRKQDIEALDKKMGTQFSQVQQEVKAASASTATLAAAMEEANGKVHQQFGSIAAALEMQASNMAKSQADMQKQLTSLGKDLLEQISGLSDAESKRKKGGGSTRGGMPTLQHREGSPARGVFAKALSMDAAVQDLDDERSSSSSTSSQSRASSRSPCRREWDDRIVQRVRALSQGLSYGGDHIDEREVQDHGMDTKAKHDKQDVEPEPVAKDALKNDPKQLAVPLQELQPSDNGVRCVVSKYAQLNVQLSQKREQAWEGGLHIWVLLQDGELVSPVGFMPHGIPRCQPRQTQPGYSLQCWVCGLTFPTARLKPVSKFRCAYSGLAAGRSLKDVGKVLIHRRVWPLFASWLQKQNALPERKDLHWPILLPLEAGEVEAENSYKLRCSKCGGGDGPCS